MNSTRVLIVSGMAVGIISLVILFSSLSFSSSLLQASEIKSNLAPELLTLPNANLTDDQLIAKTRDVKEIQVFLNKYPDAKPPGVYRAYEIKSDARNISVGYSVQRNVVYANGTSELRELAIDVDFDRYSNKTLDVGFSCFAYHGGLATDLKSGIAMVADIEKGLCFN